MSAGSILSEPAERAVNSLIISTDGARAGGINNFCSTLSAEITNSHYIVIDSACDARCELHLPRRGRSPLSMFNYSKLFAYLKESDPDVVYLNDPQFSSVSAVVLFWKLRCRNDARVIFISHGFIFHNSQGYFRRAYFKFAVRLYVNNFTFVAVSESDLDRLRLAGVNDAALITNGVRLVEKKAKVAGLAVCIARNVPHKRIDVLIEVAKQSERLGSCGIERIVLVTDGGVQSAGLVDSRLDIKKSLSDSQLADLQAQAEYVFSFSEYEGFGLAVVETVMAGAIPLLYSNSSFSRIFNSVPELLFTKNDPETFLSALERIKLISPKERGRLQSLCIASVEEFSSTRMAKEYRSLAQAGF